MKKSLHPGEVVRARLTETKLPVKRLAQSLDLDFSTLSGLSKCERRLTAYLAVKLAQFFETTPEFWLELQMKYDLWKVQSEVYFPKITTAKQLIKEIRKAKRQNKIVPFLNKHKGFD